MKPIEISQLAITPVNPNDPLPLYYQVYQDLKAIILSEKIKAGDMLPPEMVLCQQYGVGRQTIRQAIARLVNEGLLERFAGRGTFILPAQENRRFYLDRSFTQQMAEMGLIASSEVLEVFTGVIDHSAPRAFHDKIGQSCLVLTRLRFCSHPLEFNREPLGLQESIILTQRCPGIEKVDFNIHSLYQVLSENYHLEIEKISHVVSAIAANDSQADLLQVQPGTPLLIVQTVAYLSDKEPIESTTSYYRADKYEFSVTHTLSECN